MHAKSPVDTVLAFFSEWEIDRDRFFSSFRDFLSSDVIWDNVGLARTEGIEAALGLMQAFEQNLGMNTMKVEMLNISVTGRKVLTERIDHVFDKNGDEITTIALMGILEVNEEGRIAQWRDYFDTLPFRR
jgi:limonene-1,2-epoxide hydrolase